MHPNDVSSHISTHTHTHTHANMQRRRGQIHTSSTNEQQRNSTHVALDGSCRVGSNKSEKKTDKYQKRVSPVLKLPFLGTAFSPQVENPTGCPDWVSFTTDIPDFGDYAGYPFLVTPVPVSGDMDQSCAVGCLREANPNPTPNPHGGWTMALVKF